MPSSAPPRPPARPVRPPALVRGRGPSTLGAALEPAGELPLSIGVYGICSHARHVLTLFLGRCPIPSSSFLPLSSHSCLRTQGMTPPSERVRRAGDAESVLDACRGPRPARGFEGDAATPASAGVCRLFARRRPAHDAAAAPEPRTRSSCSSSWSRMVVMHRQAYRRLPLGASVDWSPRQARPSRSSRISFPPLPHVAAIQLQSICMMYYKYDSFFAQRWPAYRVCAIALILNNADDMRRYGALFEVV
jgi:hypothetical protein